MTDPKPNFDFYAELCRQAKGPDRKLDAIMLAAVDWKEDGWEEGDRTIREMVLQRGADYMASRMTEGMSIWRNWPRLTSSLDAVIACIDPRALRAYGTMEEGPFARLCWPMPDGGYTGGYIEEMGLASEPLALCAAWMTALARHGQ